MNEGSRTGVYLGGFVLCIVLACEGAFLLYHDLQRMARPNVKIAPSPASDGTSGTSNAVTELMAVSDGSSDGDVLAPPPPQLPLVALMFLTRGEMPLEPLWRAFLSAAAAAAANATVGSGNAAAADASSLQQTAGPSLFSIYTHPLPGFAYPPGSLFAGSEVEGRVEVKWGQHSVVEAERALLRAALGNPWNQRFVLLSESCLPLYPPAFVWWQLVSETRSRVNACSNSSDPQDGQTRMDFRWHPNMAAAGVSRAQWRKASQWKALVRRHAELVVADQAVAAVFAKECWAEMGPTVRRFCVSDEHYVPTLLAHAGLEGEVDCKAVSTHTHWDGPYFHPKSYTGDEATTQGLAWLRGTHCKWREEQGADARRWLAAAIERLRSQQAQLVSEGQAGGQQPGEGGQSAGQGTAAAARGGVEDEVGGGGGGGGDDSARQQEVVYEAFKVLTKVLAMFAAEQSLLPSSCPLFARKVVAEGAAAWGQVLEPELALRRRL